MSHCNSFGTWIQLFANLRLFNITLMAHMYMLLTMLSNSHFILNQDC